MLGSLPCEGPLFSRQGLALKEVFCPCSGRVHLGQTVCSHLAYRVMPADKQAPALLGALLGTFSGSMYCVSPVWDGLPTTALLALQQELGFTTAQHAGLNPVSFR